MAETLQLVSGSTDKDSKNTSLSSDLSKPSDTVELEAPDISQSSSDSTMIPSLPSFNKHLKQGVPLLVLLIFNVVYTHTVYFALFIGLLVVFDWANDVIVRQSTLQEHRSVGTLLFITIFLLLNTVLSLPIIETFWLCNFTHFSFWLHSTSLFWNVLFNVVVMDFVLKFITLSIKCCISIPSNRIIATNKRGGCFVLFEALSQLVRCFMPMPEWIAYILKSSTCVGCIAVFMCWFVAALYCVVKVIGRPLVLEDEMKSLQPCPICRGKCKAPVALSCDHSFCHSCCQMWFDWDKHCPVCSSNAVYSIVLGERQRMPSLLQISSKNSIWRRGNTDYLVQLF